MSREEVPAVTRRTRREVEDRALKFVRYFYPHCLEMPQPVPVENFLQFKISKHKNIVFEVDDLPFPCEAVLTPGSNGDAARLVMSGRTYQWLLAGNPRARFTAGHESGHAVLHADEIAQVLANSKREGFYRRSQIQSEINPERQADWFSAAFLMPEPAMRVAVHQHGPNAASLARIFMVSEQAMRHRLGELGLR